MYIWYLCFSQLLGIPEKEEDGLSGGRLREVVVCEVAGFPGGSPETEAAELELFLFRGREDPEIKAWEWVLPA